MRVSIDLHPADNGAVRNQNQWIRFFNEQERIMISAPDVYQAGKYASDEVLSSLRRTFDEYWLILSTRPIYSGDDLSGRIIQNYGSKVVRPSPTDVPVIPVYDGTPLTQALQTKEGVSYLQALLDTSDEPRDIAGTLEKLSKRGEDRIELWTPSQASRQYYDRERGVRFYYYGDRFRVGGNIHLVTVGLSRGVS